MSVAALPRPREPSKCHPTAPRSSGVILGSQQNQDKFPDFTGTFLMLATREKQSCEGRADAITAGISANFSIEHPRKSARFTSTVEKWSARNRLRSVADRGDKLAAIHKKYQNNLINEVEISTESFPHVCMQAPNKARVWNSGLRMSERSLSPSSAEGISYDHSSSTNLL